MKFELMKDIPAPLKSVKEKLATIVFKTKQIYLFDDEVWKVVEKIQETGRFPYFAGLFMGDITKVRYYPSLSAAEYINFKKVVIKDTAAPKFVYGNNLPYTDIIENEAKFNEAAKVVNKAGEFLGYCIVRENRIENVKDIGEYLREEMEKKKDFIKSGKK